MSYCFNNDFFSLNVQCVVLTSVGKKPSKTAVFLIPRSCVLWTCPPSGSSRVMWSAVASPTTGLFLFFETTNPSPFPSTGPARQGWQRSVAPLGFVFPVVTVELSQKRVPLCAAVQPKALAGLALLSRSLMLYCRNGDIYLFLSKPMSSISLIFLSSMKLETKKGLIYMLTSTVTSNCWVGAAYN